MQPEGRCETSGASLTRLSAEPVSLECPCQLCGEADQLQVPAATTALSCMQASMFCLSRPVPYCLTTTCCRLPTSVDGVCAGDDSAVGCGAVDLAQIYAGQHALSQRISHRLPSTHWRQLVGVTHQHEGAVRAEPPAIGNHGHVGPAQRHAQQ